MGAVVGVEPVQRLDVGIGQIGDVDVVADAGAVGGGVIVAEQGQRRAVAGDRLHRQRDEVRFGIVELANLAIGVGAGGVEVAKSYCAYPMRGTEIGDHLLGGPFRLAVGIDRKFWRILLNWNTVRRPVGRGGAGEDEPADRMIAHRLEQRQGARDIVAIIFAGIGHRLADIGERREMHHRHRPVSRDRRIERRAVGDIADLERPPLHRLAVPVDQIVIDDREKSARTKRLAGMRADITGSPGDQDRNRGCVRDGGHRFALEPQAVPRQSSPWLRKIVAGVRQKIKP